MKKKIFKLLMGLAFFATVSTISPSQEYLNLTAEAATTKISSTKKSIRKGKSFTLSLKNIDNKEISWSVSNKSIISIKKTSSTKVKVTAKKAGTSYVYAKVNGKTYKCKVTVKAPLELSDTSKTIQVNEKFTISMNSTSSNIKWNIGNKKVAKLVRTGKNKYRVVGLKTGSTNVYAKVDGKTYKCKVTVKGTPKISSSSISVNYKSSKSLTFKNAISGRKFRWTIGNDSIASIKSSGTTVKITGKKVGTTNLYAKYDGKTYKCKVAVKKISNPKFDSSLYTVEPGSTVKLSVSGEKGSLSNWKSSNMSVATVKSGRVTGVKTGTVTISCMADGLTIKTKVQVANKDNTDLPIETPDINDNIVNSGSDNNAGNDATKDTNSSILTEDNTINNQNTTEKDTEKSTEKDTENDVTETEELTESYEPLKIIEGNNIHDIEVGESFLIKVNNEIKSISISPQGIARTPEIRGVYAELFFVLEPGKIEIEITDVYDQKVIVQATGIQKVWMKDHIMSLTETRTDNTLPIPQIEDIYTYGTATIILPGTFNDTDLYDGYEGRICRSKNFDTYFESGTATNQWNNLGYARISFPNGIYRGKYYIKVRSFCIDGSTKICGPWSTVRQITIPDILYGQQNSNKAQYSYDLFFLTPKEIGLYDGNVKVVYIKTNNPDPNTISLNSDGMSYYNVTILGNPGHYYDDIHYLKINDYNQHLKKVDGGYVAYVRFDTPGSYKVEVREYGVDGYSVEKTTTWTVQDYEEAMYTWVDGIIAAHTTASMTPFEKMDAICKYLNTPGLFKYVTQSNGENVVLASMPNNPCFVTYRWDSATSPSMLCVFAERIGGFDDIHNCYGDYPVGSSQWSSTHYLARLTIGDDVRYYEVCPPSSTGDIGEVKYIDFSDTSKLTPAD